MEEFNNKDKRVSRKKFKRELENRHEEIRIWLRTVHSQTSKSLSISDIMVNHAVGYNKGKRIYQQLQTEGIIDENGNILRIE